MKRFPPQLNQINTKDLKHVHFTLILVKNQNISCKKLACVAIAQKLERKRKKKGRRGRGEEETLARKPHDSGKRPLIFHGSVRL